MKRIYTVRQTFKYTVDVEVEASSEREAKDLSDSMEGVRNYDDYLYDCEVLRERDVEE